MKVERRTEQNSIAYTVVIGVVVLYCINFESSKSTAKNQEDENNSPERTAKWKWIHNVKKTSK